MFSFLKHVLLWENFWFWSLFPLGQPCFFISFCITLKNGEFLDTQRYLLNCSIDVESVIQMSHSTGIEYSLCTWWHIFSKYTRKHTHKIFPPTVYPEPDLAVAHGENCFPVTDNLWGRWHDTIQCQVKDMENTTAGEWEYQQKHKECSGHPTLSTIRYKVPGPGGMRTPACGWACQGWEVVLIKEWATDRRRHLHRQVWGCPDLGCPCCGSPTPQTEDSNTSGV